MTTMKIFLKYQLVFALVCFFTATLALTRTRTGLRSAICSAGVTLSKVIEGPRDMAWDKLQGNWVVLGFWATWCGRLREGHYSCDMTWWTNSDGQPGLVISETSKTRTSCAFFLKKHTIKSAIALDDYETLK